MVHSDSDWKTQGDGESWPTIEVARYGMHAGPLFKLEIRCWRAGSVVRMPRPPHLCYFPPPCCTPSLVRHPCRLFSLLYLPSLSPSSWKPVTQTCASRSLGLPWPRFLFSLCLTTLPVTLANILKLGTLTFIFGKIHIHVWRLRSVSVRTWWADKIREICQSEGRLSKIQSCCGYHMWWVPGLNQCHSSLLPISIGAPSRNLWLKLQKEWISSS